MGYWEGSTWNTDERPKAKVTSSTPVSIPSGTEVVVPFDTVAFLDHFTADSVNYRLYCQSNGVYRISGRVGLSGGGTGTVTVSLRKNGSAIAQGVAVTSASVVQPVVTDLIQLVSGDYLDLTIQHNTGSPKDTYIASLCMELV